MSNFLDDAAPETLSVASDSSVPPEEPGFVGTQDMLSPKCPGLDGPLGPGTASSREGRVKL
jgi:hypothetical protein